MRYDCLPYGDAPLDQAFGPTAATFEIPWKGGYYHTGVDIGDNACYGTDVIATRAGIVLCVGAVFERLRDGSGYIWDNTSFGINAVVWQPDGEDVWIVEGHLSTALCSVGEHFQPGFQLGVAGGWPNSGQGVSTGPHLHKEVQPVNQPFLNPATAIDPTPYLNFTQGDSDMIRLVHDVSNDVVYLWNLYNGTVRHIPQPDQLADIQRVLNIATVEDIGDDTIQWLLSSATNQP